MTENIYRALRPISGKFGYEMRRSGGLSGLVCPAADLGLLCVISENKGATPRKCWASPIICGRNQYYIVY